MAQILVLGTGKPQSCYNYAFTGNQGTRTAINTCRDALEETLSQKDRTATHVNLGLLLMRKGELEKAEAQYKIAMDMQPGVTEIYINYGAALILMDKRDEALSYLNKAISLDTPRMKEALYNRAIIYHAEENYKSAYDDLKAVLALEPEFEPAQSFIARYSVQRSG